MKHIGAYVLYDPSVNCLSEPCGLCLWLAPLCKIVLRRAKGQTGRLTIDIKKSSCANLVKLSIGAAARYSHASPCTNHPVICPYCDSLESSPVVWSYNFWSHLLRKHPRISLEDHNNMFILTKLKKKGMKHVWNSHFKQQNAHQKSQYAPLAISEIYCSHLVFRYTFLFYLQYH